MPQQNIAGTGSGYIPGNNPTIQQQPAQNNLANSNPNLSPSQSNKIS
jgi:hypothetical protein